VEEGDGDRNPVCKYFWKKGHESLSCLSFNEFNLATNNTLGYDIPRVMGITEDDIMYYVLLVIGLIPVASIP